MKEYKQLGAYGIMINNNKILLIKKEKWSLQKNNNINKLI